MMDCKSLECFREIRSHFSRKHSNALLEKSRHGPTGIVSIIAQLRRRAY